MFLEPRAGPALVNRRRARDVIAVRVRDEHQPGTTGRGRGNRLEVRRMADAGVDQDRPALANQVGPVPFAGHRARVGRMQELRIHRVERRPMTDTANATSISEAAVRYGVVIPYAS